MTVNTTGENANARQRGLLAARGESRRRALAAVDPQWDALREKRRARPNYVLRYRIELARV